MVVGNPFLAIEQYEDIENYVIPIYNRIHSFGGHLPARIECIGNWLVEAGDIITAYVSDVDTIQMPIFCRTLRWNGAITAEYETTGTIRWNAVSASNKEKIWTRNRIRFIATDECYKRQSGIEIQPEGIDISGDRYLRLESGSEIDIDASGNLKLYGSIVEIKSGSTFDVDATNFKIDSVNKLLKAGNWKFDVDGVEYNNNTFDAFLIGKRDNNDPVPKDKNGVFYYTEGIQGQDCAGIDFYACSTQYDGYTKYTAQLSFQTAVSSVDQNRYNTLVLYDNGSDNNYVNVLGSKFFPFGEAYLSNLYIRNICNMLANTGSFKVYPRGLTDSYIVFQQYTNNGNQYTKIYGSIGANMIFEGQHTAPSSRDIKHDIKKLESQGEVIDSLEPVSFTYDDDPSEAKHFGLIYEDTINVLPEVCTGDETSKAINYVELVPLLLKEIQDLRKRVAQLEEREV